MEQELKQDDRSQLFFHLNSLESFSDFSDGQWGSKIDNFLLELNDFITASLSRLDNFS